MSRKHKKTITVILDADQFEAFDSYCIDKGYKKSTLLARLIRELLEND